MSSCHDYTGRKFENNLLTLVQKAHFNSQIPLIHYDIVNIYIYKQKAHIFHKCSLHHMTETMSKRNRSKLHCVAYNVTRPIYCSFITHVLVWPYNFVRIMKTNATKRCKLTCYVTTTTWWDWRRVAGDILVRRVTIIRAHTIHYSWLLSSSIYYVNFAMA